MPFDPATWTPPPTLLDSFATGVGVDEAIQATEQAVEQAMVEAGIAPDRARLAAHAAVGGFVATLGEGVGTDAAVAAARQSLESAAGGDAASGPQDQIKALAEALARGDPASGQILADIVSDFADGTNAEAIARAVLQQALAGGGSLELALRAAISAAEAAQQTDRAGAVPQNTADAATSALAVGGDAAARAVDTLTAGMPPAQATAFVDAFLGALGNGVGGAAALAAGLTAADAAARATTAGTVATTLADQLAGVLASGGNVAEALNAAGITGAAADALATALGQGAASGAALSSAQQTAAAAARIGAAATAGVSADPLAAALASGDGAGALVAAAAAQAAQGDASASAAFVDGLMQALASGSAVAGGLGSAASQAAAATAQAATAQAPDTPATALAQALAGSGDLPATLGTITQGDGAAFAAALQTALAGGQDLGAAVAQAGAAGSAATQQLAAGTQGAPAADAALATAGPAPPAAEPPAPQQVAEAPVAPEPVQAPVSGQAAGPVSGPVSGPTPIVLALAAEGPFSALLNPSLLPPEADPAPPSTPAPVPAPVPTVTEPTPPPLPGPSAAPAGSEALPQYVVAATQAATGSVLVALADLGSAVEAGGTANDSPGRSATGNVLANDSGSGQVSALTRVGRYGTLTLEADGSYRYVVDDDKTAVQALASGQSASESFDYTITNSLQSASAGLTVTITGANDAPVATDDAAGATEAGGTANGSPGSAATGNLLSNDSDVDSGAALTVAGISFGATAGTVGSALAGAYGALTVTADGGFSYTVDDANAAVQALAAGASLSETFGYTVSDGNLTDSGVLTVTITGANDAPVATDDAAGATEAGGTANGSPGSAATGNLLSNDSDVDSGAQLTVAGISFGAAAGTVGTALAGAYGALTVTADGGFSYTVDDANAAVQALAAGASLSETFGYTVSDGNLTDRGVLTVTITGANDAPTLTATAANPGYTEQASAVSLFAGSSASTVDDGQTLSQLTLTVSNLKNGAHEILSIDGSDVGLAAGTSGTTATGHYGYAVTVSGTTATVTLSTGTASAAAIQAVVDGLTYRNTDDDPGSASRTVTITSLVDSSISANTAGPMIASTVTVTQVNDAPTLTAQSYAPVAILNGGASKAVLLFSAATAAAVEAGDRFSGLTVTVSNLHDGANEKLLIDGSYFSLTSASGATTAGGYAVAVAVAGSTGTVTISKSDGFGAADAATLITGLAYTDTAGSGSAGTRTVTLTRLQDDGGTAGGGDDSASLSTAATVSLVDAATLSRTGTVLLGVEETYSVTLQAGVTYRIDLKSTGLNALDPVVRVYSAGDSLLAQDDNSGSGDNARLDFTPSSTATYKIGADGTGLLGSNGGFALTVKAISSASAAPDLPALTITASPADPAYTEQAAATGLFSNAAVATKTAGQHIAQLVLTVSGLQNGAHEILSVDGSELGLGGGATGTTAGHGYGYAVTVSGDTATVTIATGSAAPGAVATLVDGLSYRDTDDNPGQVDRVVTLTGITDSSGGTAALQVTSTVSVTPVNDAPVMTGSGRTLTAIAENLALADNHGTTVSTLLASAGSVSDVDSSHLGIAVTAVTNTNGSYQFSIDSGATWTALTGLSSAAALLLADSDLIRFVPAANTSGNTTGGLTFQAWDQSAGTHGTTVSVSGTGDSDQYSAASDTAKILVTPNGASLVSSDVDNQSGHYYQYYVMTAGTAIDWSGAEAFAEGSSYKGVSGHLSTITSASENALVKNLASQGDIWLGATDSAAEGSFVWVTGETFSYTNWSSGQPDNFNNEDYLGMYRNSGKWNDFPLSFNGLGFVIEYDTTLADPPLAPTAEDAAAPSGSSITSLYAGIDVTGGISLISNSATDDQGSWQYSLDHGDTWLAVAGDLSPDTPLALTGDAMIRFAPAADWNGAPGGLLTEVAGLDRFELITTQVVAVNDAPVVTSAGAIATIGVSDIDSTTLTGATIAISADAFRPGDRLDAVASGDITTAYDRDTGVLTLSGTDSLQRYQDVLRSVTLDPASGENAADTGTPSRTLTLRVDDGQTAQNQSTPVSATVSAAGTAAAASPDLAAGSVYQAMLLGGDIESGAGAAAPDATAATLSGDAPVVDVGAAAEPGPVDHHDGSGQAADAVDHAALLLHA
ncbi:MAG: hypothetical protein GC191_00535 [Azospirillum sp.]|nr:hypothetical protein [Azospirillum sp.]